MNSKTLEENKTTLALLMQEIHLQVDAAMREDLAAALTGCDPALSETIEYAIFGGGKKVRPALVTTCSRLCGRDDPALYRLAAAFEYLHVASLIHDDIIDKASQRRGRSTIAAQYGPSKAILAGDWLLSRSMLIVAELTGMQGLRIFCQATEGMVNGEFLQIRHVGHLSLQEKDYFSIIACKTGNLIASACTIGALYADGDAQQMSRIKQYGQKLGSAFQVIDDLLDYQGEEKNTGKPVGNDLAEGKITLPLLRALHKATEQDRRTMEYLIKHSLEEPGTYKKIFTFIEQNQGFLSAGKTAAELIQQAKDALVIFDAPEHAAQLVLLHSLADYILARNK